MSSIARLALVVSFISALALAATARAAEVTVYAAASLTDALQEIGRAYERTSGDKLVFSFGASSTLSVQIRQGAPADLFFSADEAKMDDLAKAGLVADGTRRSLLSNTLAIVVSAEGGPAISGAADLAKGSIGKIALAEPQTVPAGIYAREYLEKANLWRRVIDKVIPTENVRAALAAVESGNVDAGIVYKTDALISKKVKVAFEVPLAEGPKISYPLAVMKGSKNEAAARKLAAYLASTEARAVFTRLGFRLGQ